jgi:hypothetical protein
MASIVKRQNIRGEEWIVTTGTSAFTLVCCAALFLSRLSATRLHFPGRGVVYATPLAPPEALAALWACEDRDAIRFYPPLEPPDGKRHIPSAELRQQK